MEISISYIMVSLWIIIGLQLAFIIFLYERIVKLKFFMWMNAWKVKHINELKQKFRE